MKRFVLLALIPITAIASCKKDDADDLIHSLHYKMLKSETGSPACDSTRDAIQTHCTNPAKQGS